MAAKPDKGDEDLGGVVRAAAQNVLANPAAASTKRVAWVYGCIRAGADEEESLLVILRQKLAGQADLRQQLAGHGFVNSVNLPPAATTSTSPAPKPALDAPSKHEDPF